MSKVNKWKLVSGSIVSCNDGRTAHDLIDSNLKDATKSIINPVVDRLAMQDEAKAEAEFANLGKNIDRQRIDRFNTYLNNKLEDIANAAIEAGKHVDQQRVAIEAEVIDADVVEVKSFSDVFASKLGGALTTTATLDGRRATVSDVGGATSKGKLPEGKTKSKFDQYTK